MDIARTGVTFFVSPRITHNWRTVREPTQAMVNNPTHLTLNVAPKHRPVATSQNHHSPLKACEGPCSCLLVKQVNDKAVSAVKKTKGESRRIKRDWVINPFSAQR